MFKFLSWFTEKEVESVDPMDLEPEIDETYIHINRAQRIFNLPSTSFTITVKDVKDGYVLYDSKHIKNQVLSIQTFNYCFRKYQEK